MSESFPDGCWLVGLATVDVNESVAFAFATGVEVKAPAEGDVIDHVIARLRHKRMLIIVDNCEHVLGAAADAVERVVTACPMVVVLATSREPLMVRGERLVPVPSLSAHDAERLFLERARDEAPDLVIDEDQSHAVTELCRRLDGLPLALELAASRVRALTPVELVANLEERFRLLVGGRRSRMERHQTMRGTLDWSYSLCSDVERAVFDRLSVFPAAFDLRGARAVAGGEGVDEMDVVDVVPQLVDRSLLQRSTASDGTTRFRLLETMRAYGREHLQHEGTSDITRERHARYAARAISALSLRTMGTEEREVARRLDEHLPDALLALDWFIDHQEWENAVRVTLVGNYLSERESGEMCTRLTAAATAGGASREALDEIERNDPRSAVTQTNQQQAERGWRGVRGRVPVPSDRYVAPPHADFGDGTLAAAEVDEFLASLDRWAAAPPLNRYVAHRHAIRAVALNGHLDRVEEPLARLRSIVAELHSELASRELAEVHALVAKARYDWPAAVHWFELAQPSDGEMRTWFDLSVAWNLLTARAFDDEPFELTGADLREPWQCFRNEQIEVLVWRGVVSTAIALQRFGRVDLANRLVEWALRNDTTDALTNTFGDVLRIAGLPTAKVDHPVDLDGLIDELMRLADELDRRGDE